jgi:hypothetical protein
VLLAIALLALVVAGALFAGTAARAAEAGAFYRAELAAPVSQQQTVITDGIAWKCEGSTCSAAKGNSRDAIVCARLARKVGTLTSFASRKGALEGDDLARCNQG